MSTRLAAAALAIAIAACDLPSGDADALDPGGDGGGVDAGGPDGGAPDSGTAPDAGPALPDAGPLSFDAGPLPDAAPPPPPPPPPPAYPGGPYGKRTGNVIANVTVDGYGYPGAGSAWGPVKLEDFYDPNGTRGNKVLFVDVSAGWCGVCRQEAQDLKVKCAAKRSHGLVCYTALFQDDNGDPATRSTVDAWLADYHLGFPVVADTAFVWGDYFDSSATPMNMFVDLKTMRILEATVGYDEQWFDAAADQYAP